MRIPSQFNEDNLYRRSPNRSATSDFRRVIRMVLALILVIVLMQQASKPVIYEQFFGALTGQSEGETAVLRERVGSEAETVQGTTVDGDPDLPDPTVTASVADGTVWRSGDFPAMYRFLSDCPYESGDAAAVVSVLPLLQQPEIFRNRLVVVAGHVVRSEPIEAAENEYGIEQYWQLWLRPRGGTNRPLVIIAPSVPPPVAAIGSDALADNGPMVQVTGRFLKRLAYRSRAGAELAPVVVGSITPGEPQLVAGADKAMPAQPDHVNPLIGSLAVAILVGIGAASWVMWRTAALARRTRALRRASESSTAFLASLSHSESQADR